MNTSLRDAGPFEKIVTLQVSTDQLEEAKTRVARRLSRDLKIKGFRPGKAPRPLVEAAVGADRLRSEAIEDLLPSAVGTALTEAELAPAVAPSVESMRDVDDGVEVEVKVTIWPTLGDLPDYQGRRIELEPLEVGQDELEAQIDRLRDQFAELETVSRPAQDGDYVAVNLSATTGGAPVPEASASDLLYEVGSQSFIEGLDQALLGRSAGEIASFEGPLPAGFGELGGQTVSFRALVKEVRRKKLPELTDDWAAEVTEFDTVDDLRADLAERMGAVRREAARSELRSKALTSLVEEIELVLPEGIVNAEMDAILHRFAHQLESQGVSLADYFQVSGIDQQTFVDDLRRQAEQNVRTELVLEAVIARESLEVSDEELAEALTAVADRTDDPEEFRRRVAASGQENSLKGDILRRKALDALEASSVPVDSAGNPLDLRPASGDDEEDDQAPAEENDEA